MTENRIPGLRGLDHVGITVPDMEQAHAFFTGVLDYTFVYGLGPFLPHDDWMSEHLNVDDAAVMREIRFYRNGNGSNLEVFSYEVPERSEVPPRNSDIGGHHLAFYVDDLDAAVAYLRDRGVRVLGEPTASGGASAGQRWLYFLAPWGLQLELVSFPDGKAYEQDASVRLWDTRD